MFSVESSWRKGWRQPATASVRLYSSASTCLFLIMVRFAVVAFIRCLLAFLSTLFLKPGIFLYKKSYFRADKNPKASWIKTSFSAFSVTLIRWWVGTKITFTSITGAPFVFRFSEMIHQTSCVHDVFDKRDYFGNNSSLLNAVLRFDSSARPLATLLLWCARRPIASSPVKPELCLQPPALLCPLGYFYSGRGYSC